MEINELMKRYTPNPILVVIDVEPKDAAGLPTEAYIAIEEIHDDGTTTTKTFTHIHSEIQAEEAEEVGVEHLLRDVKDINSVGSLSSRLNVTFDSLKSLSRRLGDMQSYLEKVVAGRLPVNHDILCNLQNIFNLLPDLTAPEQSRAFTVTHNDRLLVTYLGSVARSIIALHRLIDNKAENRDAVTAQPAAPIVDSKKQEVETAGK